MPHPDVPKGGVQAIATGASRTSSDDLFLLVFAGKGRQPMPDLVLRQGCGAVPATGVELHQGNGLHQP